MDISNFDSYINVANQLTGLGVQGTDSITSNFINPAYGFYRNRGYLDSAFKSLWQARKVCEYLPFMMHRSWGKVTLGSGSPEVIEQANKAIHKLKKIYEKGQVLANLYGGATAIRLVDDGQKPDQPIDRENIKTVRYSQLYDRWYILPDSYSISIDSVNPDYYLFYSSSGYSNDYQNKLLANQYRIHKSRILRFRGSYLPPYHQKLNSGWEDSVLVGFLDPLMRHLTGLGYSGEALKTFEIIAHSIDNLFDRTRTLQGENEIKRRMLLNQKTLSALRFFALDRKTEEVNIIGRQFRGVSDILDRLKDEMIGASGLTKPQFYQEHPAGLAATGESERLAEANSILALCEQKWGENILEDIELYFLSQDSVTKGKLPTDYSWEWKSIYSLTPTEEAGIREASSRADEANIRNGIYSSQEARDSHYAQSIFDMNITLDKNTNAEDLKPQTALDKAVDTKTDNPLEVEEGKPVAEEKENSDSLVSTFTENKLRGLYNQVARLSGIPSERVDSLTLEELEIFLQQIQN